MTEPDHRSEALAAASERRIELKHAVSNLERAIAAPSAMPSWRDYVRSELDVLRTALDRHVEEVEGQDGLLVEIIEAAPRLSHRVEQVRDEHPVLRQQVADAIALAQSSDDNAHVRASVLETLFALVRHRQHGADLVFEGYNVDIGGGG